MRLTLTQKFAALTNAYDVRKDLKQLLIRKYWEKHRRYELNFSGINAIYSTEDFYSNIFFYQIFECEDNLYEPSVLTILVDKLAKHRNFVDCGANLGYFSVFASVVLKDAPVYCFEMDSTLLPIIEKNLELNGITNCTVANLAVGDDTPSITYTPHAFSFLGKASGIDTQPFSVELTTPIVRLDDYFRDAPMRPTFMKMDIDGGEWAALRGMESLLANESFEMLLEVHPADLPKIGSSVPEVLDFLKQRGFHAYQLGDFRKFSRLALSKVVDPSLLTTPSGEMLFVTREIL